MGVGVGPAHVVVEKSTEISHVVTEEKINLRGRKEEEKEIISAEISAISPVEQFQGKHILTVKQFTREGLHVLFSRAQEMKAMVQR